MGWMFCGTDSKGRQIGYGVPATCDYPGCTTKIDRGLSYACGGMHGDGTSIRDIPDGYSCEDYFCTKHQKVVEINGHCVALCFSCADKIEEDAD